MYCAILCIDMHGWAFVVWIDGVTLPHEPRETLDLI